MFFHACRGNPFCVVLPSTAGGALSPRIHHSGRRYVKLAASNGNNPFVIPVSPLSFRPRRRNHRRTPTMKVWGTKCTPHPLNRVLYLETPPVRPIRTLVPWSNIPPLEVIDTLPPLHSQPHRASCRITNFYTKPTLDSTRDSCTLHTVFQPSKLDRVDGQTSKLP